MIKVSDVIMLALQLLDRADIAEAYSEGSLTDEQSRTVYTLVHCYNSVEDELARTFFPLVAEEEIEITDGKFYYTSLAHTPVKILSLNCGGKPVKYRLTPQYVATNAAAATIKYRYVPSTKTIDDTAEYTESQLNCTLMAYGVAAEYCLIQGAAEESKSWESKYKTAVDGFRKLSPLKGYIPQRRWA